MEKGLCTVKGCVFYGRYCRVHNDIVVRKAPEIKKESEKRREINRKEYEPKARAFVAAHPKCQAGVEGVCSGKSQCVHHRRGKHSKEDLLDERYWLAVCLKCHRVIEDNPLWAKQRGLSVSRLAQIDKPKKPT